MYKPETKQDIIKFISEFFQVERGNWVTSFNFNLLPFLPPGTRH